jgi:hypothetical protein
VISSVLINEPLSINFKYFLKESNCRILPQLINYFVIPQDGMVVVVCMSRGSTAASGILSKNEDR